MSPELRFGNVLVSFARYLGKLFWPTDLAFFYPMPAAWPLATVLAAVVLLVAVSAVAFALRKSQPSLGVGWLWYLGTLVPVIGIVAVGQQAIADRYTYIPTLGILFAVVWAVHALAGRRKPMLRLATAAGIAALVVCAVLTRQQIGHWKTTETLCRHALAVTRDNHLAHDLLGVALNQQGRSDEALREHLESLRLKPAAAIPQNNAGVALQQLGRFDEAIARHQESLRLKPRYPEAFYNLGTALERRGRFEAAVTNYLQAITQRPTYADAHFNLGSLQLRLGRWEDARQQFERTLALAPDSPDVLNNLGLALMNLGRFDEAILNFDRAIQLNPAEPNSYVNAGASFQNQGNATAAVRYYQEALRLQPDHAQARANLEALNAAITNR
jgi:Flp pilus assembly protein TadD